ncbi:MAG TPA: serine hydrolase [Pyrinomonadaceae bacterium]|nr:serine hydrolase [Pyrinomonadaceae bacterium]
MRRFLALTLQVTALAISVLFASQQSLVAQTRATATANPELAERSARVDQMLAPLVQEGAPGVEVMVVQNGQIVKSSGYGLANVETRTPVTAQTVFEIGSVSKPFTAIAILMLSERGRLSLDDPVTKYLQGLPPYAQKVTIRHLLNHTSGLVDVINPRWFRKNYTPTSREVLKMLMQEQKPNAAPGEAFEYNNTGYTLLALIVEKVTGERFSKFMQENVFKPLGMTHTLIFDETKPKVLNLATSYISEGGPFQPAENLSDIYIYGAKGVWSTAEDMAKWAEALMGGKLVKADTLKQAFMPTRLNNGTISQYGYGWYVNSDEGLNVVEHAGGYLGYRATIRLYPTERTIVILLSNNSTINATPLARQIAKIYLGERMVQPTGARVDPAILQSYVGKYEGDASVMPNLIIEITLENGELFITSPIKPKTKLIAQSATEFQIAETASSVTFNQDGQGNVTGLLLKTRRVNVNARRLPSQ